jgi:putative colanic acid biosynthesis UDP-glucose lipid carrier transferase
VSQLQETPIAGFSLTETIGRENTQKRGSRTVAAECVSIFDAIVIAATAVIATHVLGFTAEPGLRTFETIQSGILAALISNRLLVAAKTYDEGRLHVWQLMPGPIFLAVIFGVVASLSFRLPYYGMPQEMYAWTVVWVTSALFVILSARMIVAKKFQQLSFAGYFDRRLAIYGAGALARRTRDYLDYHPCGVELVGVYDDRAGSDRLDTDGVIVTGTLNDMIEDGRRGAFDQVIITLPRTADRRSADIARTLEQLPVSLHIVTHMSGDLVDPLARHSVSALGPFGLLDVKRSPNEGWNPLIKRGEDLLLGTLFAILALPLMLLIVAAIKIESPGPVLFRQRRRGLNRSVFDMLKFRTMTVMEDGETITQAQPGDARVTRVGKWLRRTSLDELPQLWNVLRGEMSLVGPRPHAVAHDDSWLERHARYANRAQVKPGITGLAQVDGARGVISEEQDLRRRIEADLNYITNWSLALDLKIIFRTAFAIIRGKNAH